MDSSRILGRNVLHLIYPIRCGKNTTKNPSNGKHQILSNLNNLEHDWGNLFHLEERDEPPLSNYFPLIPEGDPNVSLIKNKQVISYFHPSIQNALFHQQNDARLRAYYFKHPHQREFSGRFFAGQRIQNFGYTQNEIRFKWIGTELYTFPNNLGFLVVRLSLNENWFYGQKKQEIVPLELWMKFCNRIRQNYQKFDGQEHLQIQETTYNATDTEVSSHFITYVKKFLSDNSKNLIISSIDPVDSQNGKDQELIEPNTFIHSFAKSEVQTELSDKELYQLIHIDDYEGESGGSPAFQQTFIEQNVYKRWMNYKSYYTAIDYGAMTLVCAPYEPDNKKRIKTEFQSDLFYQHHCRHYLLFMVLQLYYREELQELTGRYARLQHVESDEAQNILDDYYKLNQYVFFKRVSQEIQGREMWNFYYKNFDIAALLETTQHDMDELKQRRIELYTKKQQQSVMTLTIVAGITGFLGMNVLIPKFESGFPDITALADKNYADLFVLCIPLLLLLFLVTTLFIGNPWEKKSKLFIGTRLAALLIGIPLLLTLAIILVT